MISTIRALMVVALVVPVGTGGAWSSTEVVKIVATRGVLSDHYNPLTKTLALSEPVYGSNSVAAVGVANRRIAPWLVSLRVPAGMAMPCGVPSAPLSVQEPMHVSVVRSSTLSVREVSS